MIVQYDKTIYSEHAISQAINDYSSIADITLTVSENDYICKFNQSIYSMEKTVLEFSNYVLCLSVMNEKKI